MIHANDINPIKGVHNRLEYLREVVNGANYKQKDFDLKGWSPKNDEYPNNNLKYKMKSYYENKTKNKK
jgi:hypothetical protein